jgi:uncharacterized protein with PQ loop repeat
MNYLIEVIGWIGVALLATCGLPQLIKTYRIKKIDGLSLTMLLFWLTGEILTCTYVMLTSTQYQLMFNYSFNTLVVSCIVVLYFKYKN